MKKINLIVLGLICMFTLNLHAAFTPETGEKYYIVQVPSDNMSAQNVIGLSGNSQPAVGYAQINDTQVFEFIAVSGKTDTYQLKNDAGKYLNRYTPNAWDAWSVTYGNADGAKSEWIIVGDEPTNIRLNNPNGHLGSDDLNNGSYLYSNKDNNNTYYNLVKQEDLITYNIVDGTFENSLPDYTPLGAWINDAAVQMGGDGYSRVVNSAYASSGSQCLYLNYTETNGDNAISFQPNSLIPGASYTFKFKYKSSGTETNNTVNVYACETANGTKDLAIGGIVFESILPVSAEETQEAQEGSITFIPTATDNYIVFAKEDSSAEFDFYIDDLQLDVLSGIATSTESLLFNESCRVLSFSVTGISLSEEIVITSPNGITLSAYSLPENAYEATITAYYIGSAFISNQTIKISSGSFVKEIDITATCQAPSLKQKLMTSDISDITIGLAASKSIDAGNDIRDVEKIDLTALPDAYTIEVKAKITSSTGRGLDIEARNEDKTGFRIAANTANMYDLSNSNIPIVFPTDSSTDYHIYRYAVKDGKVNVYIDGKYYTTIDLTDNMKPNNLIDNGGFEFNNLDGWNGWGRDNVDDFSYEGGRSLNLEAWHGPDALVTQYVTPIEAGDYEIDFYYYKKSGNNYRWLLSLDNDVTFMNDVWHPLDIAAWTPIQQAFTATESSDLSLSFKEWNNGSSIAVDNIGLYPVEEATITPYISFGKAFGKGSADIEIEYVNYDLTDAYAPLAPALEYDCNYINNGHELAPSIGSIKGMITDLTAADAYKNDAMIVTDPERGEVLFLPNTSAGDENGNHRTIRITSDESLVGTGDFTITFWTKARYLDGKTLNGFPHLFIFDETNLELRLAAFWNNSKPSIKYGNGLYLNSALTPANYAYDWAHYAIVKEGTTLKFYINNELQASTNSYAIDNAALKSLRINSQAYGLGSFFDDIRIYHSALGQDMLEQTSLSTQSFPANGGNTEALISGNDISLTATAKDGYTFSHWSLAGESVSVESSWTFTPSATTPIANYVANFKQDEVIPSLHVKGENIAILPVSTTENLFSNRTLKLLSVIDEFDGWSFIQNNAKAGYNPGVNGSFEIKLTQSGYIYSMVANLEQIDVVETWAKTNGWELVPSYTMGFSQKRTEQLYFYRKQMSGGEWSSIILPEVFTRAIIIAPGMVMANPITDAIAVKVSSISTISSTTLQNGIDAYVDASSTSIISDVNPDIDGLQITRYEEGEESISQIVKAEEAGALYIGVASSESIFDLSTWTLFENEGFSYDEESFAIYKKDLDVDEEITLTSSTAYGIHIIGTAITTELISELVDDAIKVEVTSTAKIESVTLADDVKAYNNVEISVFSNVSNKISGLKITRYNQAESISQIVKAEEAGVLYIGVASSESTLDLSSWTLFADNGFSYDGESFAIYKKEVAISEEIILASSTAFGIHIVGTDITIKSEGGSDTQDTLADDAIVSITIYTINGLVISTENKNLPTGVYIKKTLYKSGLSASEKIMIVK